MNVGDIIYMIDNYDLAPIYKKLFPLYTKCYIKKIDGELIDASRMDNSYSLFFNSSRFINESEYKLLKRKEKLLKLIC